MSEESNIPGEMEAAAPALNEVTDSENAEIHQEDRSVPLDALQAERAERQKMHEELQMMKDHLALLQSSRPQEVQKPKDELDSLADDDVLTVGEAKKFLSRMNKQYEMSVQELRMTQKYPDYQEVVTKYLPEVLKNNPSLRNSLEKSQDYELAYYLAQNSDGYKTAHKKSKRNADAERIVQNSQRAGSLSSVGHTSPISEAKRYKQMSDEEFMNFANRNMG